VGVQPFVAAADCAHATDETQPQHSILVTQDESPRLIASAATEQILDIYDARKLVHQQTVQLGMVVGLLAAY